MEHTLNNLSHYQQTYQNRLFKRIFLEFLFGFVVMYLGCKIHPTSLLPAQPIYLSTAVVFALYSIRGYRITAGLFLGGVLAHYFSPATQEYSYVTSKLVSSMASTIQILFCGFFIRFILDKLHMSLVSMRNLKEIMVYIMLAIIIPQLAFNLLITPSITLMITGLGHTLGLLTITCVFLVWDAYVPKISPPPISKTIFLYINLLWFIIGSMTYAFCYFIYDLKMPFISINLLIITIGYFILMFISIGIVSKISNRFMSVVGMGFMGLAVLFYAILHPKLALTYEINTSYIQVGVIFMTLFWLILLSKLA